MRGIHAASASHHLRWVGLMTCGTLVFLWGSACGSRTSPRVPVAEDAGAPVDATLSFDGATAFDAGSTERDVGTLPPDACAPIDLPLTVAPTVMLLVDQSGSMELTLPSGITRWDLLERELVGPAGLVTRRASDVRFGLALYSARSRDSDEGGPPIGPCPLITSVSPTLSNAGPIRSVYRSSEPIEDTPTGDAINSIVAGLVSSGEPSRNPTILVVATDGEPDTCAELDPQNGQEEAVAAASRAFAAGIRTFVIGVGEDGISRGHLQDLANAGLGRAPTDVPAPFWRVTESAGLREALDAIVRDELACELLLSQSIDATQACRGVVRINGVPLTCEGDDGWRALDGRRIELRGAACRRIDVEPGVRVDAVFPCDVLR